MLQFANGIAAAGSGLGVATDAISIVFAVIMIAVVVMVFVMMRKQRREAGTEAAPAEFTAAAEEKKVVYITINEPVKPVEPVESEEPDEPDEPDDEPDELDMTAGVIVSANDEVRYKKSFTAKLIQASDEVKGWYSQLKNAFLSYKKISSRISWNADSINSGRIKLGKFVIRGKTLCLCLALNPDDYAETKYKVERATEKRYESVPCMYRIKGVRRAKYALELIAAVAEKYELTPITREEEDYRLPYEDTQSLIDRGLIRNV